MKQSKLFLLMMVFVFAFATSYAQDDDSSSLFILNAESGALQDNGEGQFSLTLTGADTYSWFSESIPEGELAMDAGRGDTQSLVAGWEAAPESLVAPTAVLLVDDISVELSLSVPTYDEASATISFEATLIAFNISEEVDAKKYVLPPTFENTTLFIRADAAFINDLATGASTLEGSTRGSYQRPSGYGAPNQRCVMRSDGGRYCSTPSGSPGSR